MLRELEASCFRSSKYLRMYDLSVRNGRATFLLKAGAKETFPRKKAREYPLAFVPMRAAAVETVALDEIMSQPDTSQVEATQVESKQKQSLS